MDPDPILNDSKDSDSDAFRLWLSDGEEFVCVEPGDRVGMAVVGEGLPVVHRAELPALGVARWCETSW